MDLIFLMLMAFCTIFIIALPVMLIATGILTVVSWIIDKDAKHFDMSEDLGDFYCPVCKDTTDWCSHGP